MCMYVCESIQMDDTNMNCQHKGNQWWTNRQINMPSVSVCGEERSLFVCLVCVRALYYCCDFSYFLQHIKRATNAQSQLKCFPCPVRVMHLWAYVCVCARVRAMWFYFGSHQRVGRPEMPSDDGTDRDGDIFK